MNRGQKRAQWRDQFRHEGSKTRSLAIRPPVAPVAGGATHLAPTKKATSVRVDIQELVLRGFGGAVSRDIAEGLQQKLAALVAARGVPEGWSREFSHGHAGARKIRISSGTRNHDIGEQVAQAVFDFQA